MDTMTKLLLSDPDRAFRDHYNRSSFMFAHGLDGAAFSLPDLLDVAARLPQTDEFVYWSNGAARITDRWEHGKAARLTLPETIRGIADNNSMVILKHVEQDPQIGPMLQSFLQSVVDLSGPAMRDDVVVGEALILLASPGRVTSYHIDAECNYLVQLVGDKTLSVFDPADRTLISHDELESFHDGDYNGAVYKPDRQADAQIYDLKAGHGVHIPVGAPHWVQNGDNVSVALSINYELRSVHRMSRIYQVNRRLRRRLGGSPTAPGTSAWRDALKLTVAHGLIGRSTPQGIQGGEPPGVWTPSAAG